MLKNAFPCVFQKGTPTPNTPLGPPEASSGLFYVAQIFLQKNFVSRHMKTGAIVSINCQKVALHALFLAIFLGWPLHIKCTITNSCLIFQC